MRSKPQPADPTARRRLKMTVRGAVQGVGFRPFIYRLATELGLDGWVNNSPLGVFLEVEGPPAVLEQFLLRLEKEKPPRSFIQSLETSWLDPAGYANFEIRASDTGGGKTALVLPDIATCPDCLREIFDPANRRHRYPFTNCTNCGPRFSIIEALPYDRANTSMKAFTMCPQCQAEYDDPRDRRFHAQPNACPICGPQLELWNPSGQVLAQRHEALLAAAKAIRQGQIVAVKGLGGFHLMVAAPNDEAIQRLRQRKHREEKPFGLMFPSLEQVRAVCEVSPLEERLLGSPEAPMVLLRHRRIANCELRIANDIAPSNPNLGVMLPYTPLHHLLLAELGFPVVATSGNLSDEPICTDEREALERLGGIADVFLVHNRPIVRHVDDSLVRVMLGRELVLRRARGYAPLPVLLSTPSPHSSPPLGERMPVRAGEGDSAQTEQPTACFPSLLAVGAHLKNAVALAVGPHIFISQHIGDLETIEAHGAFQRVTADLQKLYEAQPACVVADLHPDYLSTKFAQASGLPVVPVQHHLAHVFSCMAENELEPPLLGVSWDGTGLGLDGTIWGGEFFRVTETMEERLAHWRPFRLPGGDKAVKEPRRTALGLLFEMLGEAAFQRRDLPALQAFSASERATLSAMLAKQVNSPQTSSAGRLFDAVASLIGLRQQIRFEGQAAMELEFVLAGVETDESYPLQISNLKSQVTEITAPTSSKVRGSRVQFSGESPSTLNLKPETAPLLLDWSPMIEGILADHSRQTPVGLISAKFHNTLAEAIVAVARRSGETRVVLTGGCFQNRYLTETTVQRLRAEGLQPYWHQRVPPNDGGIALGQAVAVRRKRG